MKRAAIYSAILHVVVIFFLMIGIYNPFERKLADEKPLLIEFVNIADKSAAPVITPQAVDVPDEKTEEKPEPKEEPKPEPPKEEPKPTPPEPKPEPPKPVEPPKPEPAKPEPKPEPEPEAEPIPDKEAPKPEKKEPPKEKPKEEEKPVKPKEKPAPKTPPKAELTLEKKKDTSKSKDEKKKVDKDFESLLDSLQKDDSKPAPQGKKSKGAPADSIGPVVTATEIDVLRQHFRKCWSVPVGVRGAKDLAVEVQMKIGKDGVVKTADIVDKGRMARDPLFRSAAESARRAAMDPRCSPIPLSPEKYEQWKDLEMTFNPKDMY